jgi:hypothetical protein
VWIARPDAIAAAHAVGALALTTQVTIDRRDPRRRDAARTEQGTVPVAGGDTGAFVAAACAVVGRLADAIAALLTG